MTIKYYLQDNNLPNGGESYRGRVKYSGVVDMEDILDLVDSRRSVVSRGLTRAVFEEFEQILLRLLLDGCKVVTPFGVFGLTIKGLFGDVLERFDASKHEIEITVKPGESLQESFEYRAKVRKVETKRPTPFPESYTNLADEAAKDILTPGRMARVGGYHLKFDQTDPKQGIFLIPIKNGNRFERDGAPIRVEHIGRNKGRELIFLVPPDLPVGAYVLEVCACFGEDRYRKGQLSEILIVP